MDHFEYKCAAGHKLEKTLPPGTRITGRDEILCPECPVKSKALAYLMYVRHGDLHDGRRS